MRMRLIFICSILCIVCVLSSCYKDTGTNVISGNSSKLVWNEELWHTLQNDSNFIKIGELILKDRIAFNKIKGQADSEIEVRKQMDSYIVANSTINKAISKQLVILHDRYSEFSNKYYYYFLDSININLSTLSSRSQEWEVIGDCTNMRMYCGIIAQNMTELYEAYCSLCSTCQYNAFTPEHAVSVAIQRINFFTNNEHRILLNNYYSLVFIVGRNSPSCEYAGQLASQFYEMGSSIRFVAEKMNQLKYYRQYPDVLFGLPSCKKCGDYIIEGGDSSSGGDAGVMPGTVVTEVQWWPSTHERIIYDALENECLTQEQLDSINLGSLLADKEVGAQDTANAHKHAMRQLNESIEDCIVKMRDYFVDEMLIFFNDGNYIALGKGLHLISGAYSPAHRLKVWRGNFWAYLPHIAEIGAANQSGVDKSIVAVKWIYNEVVNNGRNPGTVFDEWIDERNPIAPKRAKK